MLCQGQFVQGFFPIQAGKCAVSRSVCSGLFSFGRLVSVLKVSQGFSPIQAGKCAVSRSVCSGFFTCSGW